MLARRVGINQNKLNRGFRQLLGVTVGDYVTCCRVRRAEQLLRDGSLSVSEIAYSVGYEFPANFATAFKRNRGYSPRMVRRREC